MENYGEANTGHESYVGHRIQIIPPPSSLKKTFFPKRIRFPGIHPANFRDRERIKPLCLCENKIREPIPGPRRLLIIGGEEWNRRDEWELRVGGKLPPGIENASDVCTEMPEKIRS
jgi:hypothetical protein